MAAPSNEVQLESEKHAIARDVQSVPDNAVADPADPAAPSKEVSSKRQSLSDLFTIFCAGAALISDGYQNSLMTMTNVVLQAEYKKQYTSYFSTQVSNALLVGEIFGQRYQSQSSQHCLLTSHVQDKSPSA